MVIQSKRASQVQMIIHGTPRVSRLSRSGILRIDGYSRLTSTVLRHLSAELKSEYTILGNHKPSFLSSRSRGLVRDQVIAANLVGQVHELPSISDVYGIQ